MNSLFVKLLGPFVRPWIRPLHIFMHEKPFDINLYASLFVFGVMSTLLHNFGVLNSTFEILVTLFFFMTISSIRYLYDHKDD